MGGLGVVAPQKIFANISAKFQKTPKKWTHNEESPSRNPIQSPSRNSDPKAERVEASILQNLKSVKNL